MERICGKSVGDWRQTGSQSDVNQPEGQLAEYLRSPGQHHDEDRVHAQTDQKDREFDS